MGATWTGDVKILTSWRVRNGKGALVTEDEIFGRFTDDFRRRKFVGGLLPALIDFLLELGIPSGGVESLEELFAAFPQQAFTAAGKRANTLIVERPDGTTLSIRPFYNAIERYYRAENSRHDYPSCAPHATQAWQAYEDWIDAMVRLSGPELKSLRGRAVDYVLAELPDRAFDPSTLEVDPPAFRLLLEGFDFRAPNGEPSGGAFQGAAFGFIRADNPHLQVEIDKVRTGSSRLQRIGDIDAWDGERLAITAEVKFRALEAKHIPDLSNFVNAGKTRGAITLVIAIDFAPDARQLLLDEGISPLTIVDLIEIVQMWDPAKQRIAVKSMVYYAEHVEKNSVLSDRLSRFLEDLDSEGVGS